MSVRDGKRRRPAALGPLLQHQLRNPQPQRQNSISDGADSTSSSRSNSPDSVSPYPDEQFNIINPVEYHAQVRIHQQYDRPCAVHKGKASSIFLGSLQDASDKNTLATYGITKVLTIMCSDLPEQCHAYYSGKRCYIALGDTAGANIIDTFSKSSQFLDECLQTPGNTLVHCYAGVSRSATVCIAYLMKHQGVTFEEAFRTVKESRPQVGPNFGFLGQLQTFERQLQSSAIKIGASDINRYSDRLVGQCKVAAIAKMPFPKVADMQQPVPVPRRFTHEQLAAI
jgi:predicted protein tyrosine phosphatase